MLHIFDTLRDVSTASIVFRLVLSWILGAMIGLERSYKNRPAGLRTHVLVALAATLASITGHYLYLGMKVTSDLTRIGAQVIAGMGFIGAGTIIKTKQNTIKGLTTAAGLWATGVVGLAIGSGFYEGGIIAAALILFIETGFSGLAARITVAPEISVRIVYEDKAVFDNLIRMTKDLDVTIGNLQITHLPDNKCAAILRLRGNSIINNEEFLDLFRDVDGILSAEYMDTKRG